MSHPVSGGAWSSSTPGVGSIGAGTGIAGGVSAGTTTITYLLPTPTGCYVTKPLTVNTLPSAITGTMSLCVGQSATLSSATTGGTWSSSATGTASITSGGTWTAGTTTGTATITYTAPTGCITTAVVTVNGLPSPITGATTVCEFQTTTLSSASPGGVWSSSTPAVGTISGSGVLYGASGGTTTITYALASGCYVTAVETVNPAPSAITGTLGLCVGGTTTLASTTPGGTWTSSAPSIATILAPGFIGGGSAGTANITYTIGATGCWAIATVTVNPAPSSIGGSLNVCVGSTSALSTTSPGGTWTSSNPAAGTIDATTGVFYGIAPGSSTIVYSLGSGCTVTATVTVSALPSAITGTLSLCQGACSTLGSTPTGGSWLSDNVSVATIGASTGNLCGVAAGTANITYTAASTGCRRFAIATVNSMPPAITGPTSMCAGQCNSYTSGAGGAWSSSNPAVGTINAAGTFCGLSAGTTNITYLMPTGCYRTLNVLVNGLPTGMSPSAPQVCVGSTQAMTGSPLGGTWSSSTPAVGTISTGGGMLGGISAGTTTLTYTGVTGCYITQTATVNALPGAITGVMSACVGQTTTLSATPATGTWSSSTGTGTGTIGSSTGVLTGGTAGTVSVTYTLGTGCRTTGTVTVFALPGAITGVPQVCEGGGTTTLTGTPSGGTWSSSAPGIAMVSGTGPGTATVTGISATGTPPGIATITYTLGTGCISTRDVSVNPLPLAITGGLTTCVGQTTTLSNATPSGTWAISPTTVATVSPTGIVTGVNGGSGSATALVSYTLPTGCRTTAVVTVYALPSAISPSPTTVCENGTTALSTTTPGGTWTSSNPAAGTVDVTTGVLAGIAAGTTNITYTLGTGCYSATTATVNPVPQPITGVLQVCVGQTTPLADATPSGAWSSSTPAIAPVSAGGVVTGGSPGTATISYTVPTGCSATAVVTVHALPGSITGPSPMWVCENSTVTLSCTPGGGVWSSPSGAVAVNPVSGDVTGITAGTATISYTQGIGCVRTATVTVQPQPAAITGNLNVCIGFTQTLSTTSTTGAWSSSNPSVAPVSSGGVVSGLALGTANIYYTLPVTTCARSVQVTVQPLPAPITGPGAFCNFSNATYYDASPGGIWSSSDTSIFTIIDSVMGVVYGHDTDTANIIYTLPTGCSISKSVFTILAPYPITGPHDMCYGQTRTLSNAISGGVWSSSNASIASVDPSTGVVTGVNYGNATITYVLSTGCFSTYDVTVNPIPSAIIGPIQVCEGETRFYSNAFSGGTWTSSDITLATIDTFSGALLALSGGTMQVTYTLGTGCNAMKDVTINSLPVVITGPTQVCEQDTVYEFSGPSGGIWSASTANVSIDALTGQTVGVFAGNTTISYTLGTGCFRTQDMTVNPLPASIVGVTGVCVGDQALLTCATPGGNWESSIPAIGTIGMTSGIFGGVSAGNTVVSYVLAGTGCMSTHSMTVYPNPTPISGMTTVCAGFATNLYSGPAGGVWSQGYGSYGYGSINPVTGVVSGITAGIIPVTYTLGGSGCYAVDTVEVINLPHVIGGVPNVCVNDTTILSCPVAGGVWSSSNTARATVDPMSGAVVGVSPGTAVITYMVSTGCFNVHTVTVNPLPAPITGAMQVCEQSTTILGSITPGGLWVSGNTAVGTVSPAGPSLSTVFTGISAGTANVTYILFTGCKSIAQMTVNSTPAPITGNPHICMGSSNTFTTASTGGVWSSSNPSIATIDPSSGVATSVTLGVVTISYTYPGTGCTSTRVVTVQPLPQVFNVTGGGNYCSGGTGMHVNLSGSQPGVSYELYYGTSATGFLAGTGFALDFGLHTPGGVYTVQATNVTSGCKRNMAGAATIVVNPLVTPVVGIATTPNDSVCEGETVSMTAMPTYGGTAPAYAWKVNGVFVSTANNYSYIPANGDVVTVTMTSNYNCLATTMATGTQSLTVMPSATPVAGVISTPGDTVCQYNPVTFTAAPVYGGTAPAYTWLVNGTTAAYGATFTYVPDNGDIVNLRMTSDYRCRTTNTVTSGDVTMSVDSIKIPTVTITPEPGSIVAAGKPATLHAWPENAGPNPTYEWKVNGILIPGATSQTYTAIFGDYDSISVRVISSGVCHNIGTVDWFFIGVAPLSTSQTATTISDLRLVPNPNKGTFTISGNLSTGGDEDVNAEVTDMLGQVVFRGVVKAKQGRIESRITLENNLANGMYLLTLRTGTEQKVFHFVMEQ
ncbi:MAG: Ig-like domain-containing protein [Taibaiella sp.]|nr:Ig-like domain-containing protein [Taibaiella sp.]